MRDGASSVMPILWARAQLTSAMPILWPPAQLYSGGSAAAKALMPVQTSSGRIVVYARCPRLSHIAPPNCPPRLHRTTECRLQWVGLPSAGLRPSSEFARVVGHHHPPDLLRSVSLTSIG